MNAGLALTPWGPFPGQVYRGSPVLQDDFYIGYPVIIQNTIGSLVNLADNVMVGALGTAALSGVAIANHLMFVYYVSIWGVLAGPGHLRRPICRRKRLGRLSPDVAGKIFGRAAYHGSCLSPFDCLAHPVNVPLSGGWMAVQLNEPPCWQLANSI